MPQSALLKQKTYQLKNQEPGDRFFTPIGYNLRWDKSGVQALPVRKRSLHSAFHRLFTLSRLKRLPASRRPTINRVRHIAHLNRLYALL